MMRQQKLSELHPPLHPNGGTAEPASSERAAENQFVRDQMLAQSLLAARTISICVRSTLLRRAIPEWRDGKTCQYRTRSLSIHEWWSG